LRNSRENSARGVYIIRSQSKVFLVLVMQHMKLRMCGCVAVMCTGRTFFERSGNFCKDYNKFWGWKFVGGFSVLSTHIW